MAIEDTDYWKNRKMTNERFDWKTGGDWITEYWESQKHPHRKLIIDALKKIDFESLLEIGCNCGPNLSLIAKEFPNKKLTGVDVNLDTLMKGIHLLPGVELMVLDVTKGLPKDDELYDVVLADAVFMYFDNREIKKVFNEINRVAKKAVIIVDWFAKDETIEDHHWCRNYTKMLEEIGFKVTETLLTKQTWNTESWQKHGRVFVGIR